MAKSSHKDERGEDKSQEVGLMEKSDQLPSSPVEGKKDKEPQSVDLGNIEERREVTPKSLHGTDEDTFHVHINSVPNSISQKLDDSQFVAADPSLRLPPCVELEIPDSKLPKSRLAI